MLFVCYPKCTTCQKAEKYLQAKGVEFTVRHIKEDRPTLEELTATGIEHVSVYGLIVEEGTPLCTLINEGKLSLPDEDTAADMYEFVQSFLKEQGFERYEISNYAKNGQYSKHSLVYWKYQPYAAFGAAACGFDVSSRFTASEAVSEYISQCQDTIIYNEENSHNFIGIRAGFPYFCS